MKKIIRFKILLFSVFLGYQPCLFSQIVEEQVDFSQISVDTSSFESTDILFNDYIEAKDFNHGIILHPMGNIQSRIPSIISSKADADPNGEYDFRIRGLRSFNDVQPLILVDGMPVNSMHAIHPNDIGSFEILKDGGIMALYGMQGSNGVISIKTKRAEAGEFNVNYSTYFASESMANQLDLMSGRGFTSLGGFDYGSNTDWWDEVTESGFTNSHHLSISKSLNNTSIYASFNFDNADGIARGDDFQRLAGRLGFEHKALNDRLTISANFANISRKAKLIPQYAFWQATSYNPTAPIYGEGEEFDQYGGFFQANIFWAANPVALIEQTDFRSDYKNLTAQLRADLELTKDLSIFTHYGNQNESIDRDLYFSKYSYYVGLYRNGLATQSDLTRRNEYFSSGLQFNKNWEQLKVNATLAHHYQSVSDESSSITAGDFLTDVFGTDNLSAAGDIGNGNATVDSYKGEHNIGRFSGSLNLTYKDRYFLSTNISRSGSSRLGINNKWGLFYGWNAGMHLNKNLSARFSFGKSGNLPSQNLLSQNQFTEGEPFFYNGEFINQYYYYQNPNPDLKWEETKEWSLGVDFNIFKGRLRGSIDYFSSKSNDIIMLNYEDLNEELGSRTYRNVAGVKNGGLEYTFDYQFVKKPKFTWNISLIGARYQRTKLEAYYFRGTARRDFIGVMGAGCNFPIMRMAIGSPIGDLYGYKISDFVLVSPNGSWNRIDTNGDGWVSEEDHTLLGNTQPKSSLAIVNQIKRGRFRVDFMLRGFFGHDIVNHAHSFHSAPVVVSAYNVIDRARELNNIGLTDYPDFTSEDVEKGSFLRMEYLTFSYDWNVEKIKGLKSLSLYFTAQNMFTITGYTGINPELRLFDRDNRNMQDYNLSDGTNGDPLVMGMERRNMYPNSRAFIFGLRVGL